MDMEKVPSGSLGAAWTDVSKVIDKLGVHDHLCMIYETREEQLAAALPFIRNGLERGEKCIYIADDNTADSIVDGMEAVGIDVRSEIRAGRLSLLSKQDTYLKQGYFDPDRMIGFIARAEDEAKAAGFFALRITGEMTWVLGGDPGADRLMEYEAKLNYFYPDHDVIICCQYNRNRFPPKVIKDVISTHPLVIYGNTVCRNFYYVPPDEYLAPEQPAREIERLLKNISAWKKSEDELARDEALLNSTERLSKVGGWEWDIGKQEMFWTEGTYRIRDIVPAGLVLRSPDHVSGGLDCYDPADRPTVLDAFLRCVTDGEPYDLELPFTTATGNRLWVRTTAEAVREEERIVKVIGNVMDITDRKQSEDLIEAARSRAEEEKAKTDAILAAIGDGISIQDKQYRVLYQNEVHKSYIGEQTGRYCYEAYECKDDVCEGCPVAMAYGDGRTHTVERRVDIGGRICLFEITASPLRDASGELVGGIEVVREITARRRGEEDRTRLALAVEQAAEAIVITDRGGTIQYVNPAFERITGYSREEAVGRNPRILRSGHHAPSFYREMWATIERGDVWTGHFINWRKDGSLYEEDATISPVRDSSGDIVSFVAVKKDVTRMVSLEKQVRMAQKMESVGTLAGGIAHDFNNVLTVILGFGEMLKLRIAGDPKAVSDLDEILRGAERASVLTRELLTFARRQVVEPVNLDLNEVMSGLVKLIRKVTRADIEIKLVPAEESVMIRADRGQVEQVVMNLCLNARDAMPEGGQLAIETAATSLEEGYLKRYPYMKAGRYSVLSVSDTGIGMDEETRERIFEPFFTTKGPDKGTGLGLAVVYGIVKQHNGFIHVYSEPGKGSTFRVYFPEVRAAADARVVVSQEAVRGGKETILLAEDNESVRHLTEQTLTSYGYKVLVACDGEEALDIFRRHGKDITMVVLDVVMPKKGGKQAYDEMIAAIPGMKVLFLSGYSANAIHDSFFLHPGISFLQKPFGPGALARKVREVLDGK